MSNLDEKGFVFLDDRNAPYQVRMWDGKPWLCYWNEAYKCFTSLRPVSQAEILQFSKHRLPQDQADLYLDYKAQFVEGGDDE